LVPKTEFKGSPVYAPPNVFYNTSFKNIRLSAPLSLSVVDPYHFNADPDADLDSTYHPDADPSFKKGLKPLKVLK
jgi:hypothetical protein